MIQHPRPPLPAAIGANRSRYNQREIRDSLQNANLWKAYLYELQLAAPTPKRVVAQRNIPDSIRPAHYGREFHGQMSREDAEQLLQGEDGRYLVRESKRIPGQYTLSLRFNRITKNFRLYHDGHKHFVGEKKFDTIHDLVADGLITLYLEQHAGEYIASLGSVFRLANFYEHYDTFRTLIKNVFRIQKKSKKCMHDLKNCQQCKYEESPYMTLHKRHRQNRSRVSHNLRKARDLGHQRSSRPPPFEALRISNDDPSLQIPEEPEELNIQQIEKAHNFKVHNFMGLPWCDFCGNFMWGILAQGVRCDDCGFSAHRKCSEKVPADCCPDLRHIKRTFGVDLTTLVKATNVIRPTIVDACIKEIENRGLHVEGLYRVSGFLDDVESLKVKLESESEHAENHLRICDDVHIITGVLKMYFRLLPVPLITFDTYPYFLSAIKRKRDDEKVHGLKEAVGKLPPAHFQTLKFLLAHLSRVAHQSDHNLMTAYNLGTIFSPTLMRTPGIGLQPFQMNAWQDEVIVVEMLVNHHAALFK